MVTGFIKQKSHLIRDTFEAHGKSISILTKVLFCIQTKITDFAKLIISIVKYNLV